MTDVTQILNAIEQGDPTAAEQLLPLVYDELRKLAAAKLAQEKPGQTLQATALVHEAYIRLVDLEKVQHWDSRRHFFSAAAESMRRILIERARQKQTIKLGSDHKQVDLDAVEPAVIPMPCDDLLGLNEALCKLERKDPRKAELVKLRFFAGLTTAVNQAGYKAPDYYGERSVARYGQVIQSVPRLPRSTTMRHVARVLALVLALTASVSSCFAAEPKLKPGDYVAVIGDSITEQCLYSLFIEDYLLMCKPALDLQATQFGWGGETAPGYASRMANDTLRFQPSVATTCFGMNDGGYSPMDLAKGQRYRESQKSIVAQMKKVGVRLIVVGSPGVVDADTFGGNNPEAAAMYNKTLTALRDIAQEVAKEEGVVFANVYDPMMAAMTKAKAKCGKAYHVGGGDGVHPDRNGHLVMAYAFLKALGCDGNIGTITVDLAANRAEATEGHKVLSCQGGAVEVESSRYPFCFYGEADKPNATRGIIDFFPFNEELNRFKLVVRGAQGKVRVTWGKTSKEFTATELANGINLAAEFLDNPFSEPFAKVEGAIARKQGMEVGLIKTLIHNLPAYKRAAPEEAPAVDRIAEGLVKQDKQAREAAAAAVQPVKHTIKIEALK